MMVVPEAALQAQRAANAGLAAMPHPDVRTAAGLAAVRATPPSGAPTTLAGRDIHVGPLRVRTFTPEQAPRGTLLRVHGGGFAVGSPEHDDALNDRLARACGVLVASPAYRRVPEHGLADAIEDVASALRWALDGAGTVLLAGTSAGSHLALSAALRVRDDPGLSGLGGLVGMHLDCGRYDLAGTPSALAADDRTLLLTRDWLDGFRALAVPGITGAALRDPSRSPLFADLSGLPPALLTVGELDPLIDDSRLLAAALPQAELEVWPSAPHSFLGSGTPLAELALARAFRWLDARLRTV